MNSQLFQIIVYDRRASEHEVRDDVSGVHDLFNRQVCERCVYMFKKLEPSRGSPSLQNFVLGDRGDRHLASE